MGFLRQEYWNGLPCPPLWLSRNLLKYVNNYFTWVVSSHTTWSLPSLDTAAAKSLQLCPTLHDPIDCSPPGSSVHAIFQARVLEWGAFAFSAVCTAAAATAAKSLQSCPTLCDPIDGSPPGFPVPGILQARTLECVAISFSNVWKWKVKVKLLNCVWLLSTPWTAAHQAPPSMQFSRQEYWSGVPLPCPNYILGVLKIFSQISLVTRNFKDFIG